MLMLCIVLYNPVYELWTCAGRRVGIHASKIIFLNKLEWKFIIFLLFFVLLAPLISPVCFPAAVIFRSAPDWCHESGSTTRPRCIQAPWSPVQAPVRLCPQRRASQRFSRRFSRGFLMSDLYFSRPRFGFIPAWFVLTLSTSTNYFVLSP